MKRIHNETKLISDDFYSTKSHKITTETVVVIHRDNVILRINKYLDKNYLIEISDDGSVFKGHYNIADIVIVNRELYGNLYEYELYEVGVGSDEIVPVPNDPIFKHMIGKLADDIGITLTMRNEKV